MVERSEIISTRGRSYTLRDTSVACLLTLNMESEPLVCGEEPEAVTCDIQANNLLVDRTKSLLWKDLIERGRILTSRSSIPPTTDDLSKLMTLMTELLREIGDVPVCSTFVEKFVNLHEEHARAKQKLVKLKTRRDSEAEVTRVLSKKLATFNVQNQLLSSLQTFTGEHLDDNQDSAVAAFRNLMEQSFEQSLFTDTSTSGFAQPVKPELSLPSTARSLLEPRAQPRRNRDQFIIARCKINGEPRTLYSMLEIELLLKRYTGKRSGSRASCLYCKPSCQLLVKPEAFTRDEVRCHIIEKLNLIFFCNACDDPEKGFKELRHLEIHVTNVHTSILV
ncbi:hypothetical protein HDE_00769 [Halotydeus destructor]|nr:hypothetical protein HDE_00769 [Halotydeus destructor]